MLIQDAIQPPRLILIPRNPIRNLLRRVPMEVISLSLHGPDPSIEEEEPVVDFVSLAATGRIGDLVLVLIVLLDQVLHDAAGFEQADHLAIGKCVCESGNAAVWINLEKPGLFLGVGLDVDLVGFVRKAADGEVYSAMDNGMGKKILGSYPSSSRVIEILIPFGVWVV